MDKCTKCQRLLRVSSYNQPKDTKFIRKKRRSAGPSQVWSLLFFVTRFSLIATYSIRSSWVPFQRVQPASPGASQWNEETFRLAQKARADTTQNQANELATTHRKYPSTRPWWPFRCWREWRWDTARSKGHGKGVWRIGLKDACQRGTREHYERSNRK